MTYPIWAGVDEANGAPNIDGCCCCGVAVPTIGDPNENDAMAI